MAETSDSKTVELLSSGTTGPLWLALASSSGMMGEADGNASSFAENWKKMNAKDFSTGLVVDVRAQCPHLHHTSPSGNVSSIYRPYFDDFGPYPIHVALEVATFLDGEVASHEKQEDARDGLVWLVDTDSLRETTNQVLLALQYTAIKMFDAASSESRSCHSVANIWSYCRSVLQGLVEKHTLPFHDASPNKDPFGISVWDCFQAFLRSNIFARPQQTQEECQVWRSLHFESPIKAFLEASALMAVLDCNIVTPRILAMSSPGVSEEMDVARGQHVFPTLNIRHVVQLSDEPVYDPNVSLPSGLVREGEDGGSEPFSMEHHHVAFPDGSIPTLALVEKVLNIMNPCRRRCTPVPEGPRVSQLQPVEEEAYGGVAIHCKAGIGRTGTMIALYLIDRYGCSGRDAIAWTRQCRQGAVVGPQQEFVDWYSKVPKVDRLPIVKGIIKAPTTPKGKIRVSFGGSTDCPPPPSRVEEEEVPPHPPRRRDRCSGAQTPTPQETPEAEQDEDVFLHDPTEPIRPQEEGNSEPNGTETKEEAEDGKRGFNYFSRRAIPSVPTRPQTSTEPIILNPTTAAPSPTRVQVIRTRKITAGPERNTGGSNDQSSMCPPQEQETPPPQREQNASLEGKREGAPVTEISSHSTVVSQQQQVDQGDEFHHQDQATTATTPEPRRVRVYL